MVQEAPVATQLDHITSENASLGSKSTDLVGGCKCYTFRDLGQVLKSQGNTEGSNSLLLMFDEEELALS